MLKVITTPDPVLAQVAKPITHIDKEIIALIEEMKQTLKATKDPEGVGLAAPQVGKSLGLFIVQSTPKSTVTVFINPDVQEITTDSKTDFYGSHQSKSVSQSVKIAKSSKKLEGCLSLPNIWGIVHRAPKVGVLYKDEHGISHKKIFSGFSAVIIQHEFDHLNGILFPKRVLEQKQKLYKSHKNEKGEDEFEEINI